MHRSPCQACCRCPRKHFNAAPSISKLTSPLPLSLFLPHFSRGPRLETSAPSSGLRPQVLTDNPLADFVELPDEYRGSLHYCNVLAGVIRGALEMVGYTTHAYRCARTGDGARSGCKAAMLVPVTVVREVVHAVQMAPIQHERAFRC